MEGSNFDEFEAVLFNKSQNCLVQKSAVLLTCAKAFQFVVSFD